MATEKFLALAVVGLLITACSPKQQGAQNAITLGGAQTTASTVVGGQSAQPTSAANATVFGRIVDNDWYMVATSTSGVKPLVIWAPSHAECEKSAGEFNLKSVNPQQQTEPAKAWCAQGREIRAKLHI